MNLLRKLRIYNIIDNIKMDYFVDSSGIYITSSFVFQYLLYIITENKNYMDLPDNSELFNDLSFDRISAKEIYKIMEKYKNDPKRIRIGKKDIRSAFEVKNNPNNTNEKEVYYYSSRYLSLQDATYELYHYFLGTNYLGSFWYVITDQIIQTIIIAECIRKVYRRKKYEK